MAAADLGLPADMSAPGPLVSRRDPARVIVSGWQVFDGKGRPVEHYEPFFARGWAFQSQSGRAEGHRIRLEYDPLGAARSE